MKGKTNLLMVVSVTLLIAAIVSLLFLGSQVFIFFGIPSGQIYQVGEVVSFTFICPAVDTEFGNCVAAGGNSGDAVEILLNDPSGVLINSGTLGSNNCPMGVSCFRFEQTFQQEGELTLYGSVRDSATLQIIYTASKTINIEAEPTCTNECSGAGDPVGCWDDDSIASCSLNTQTGCWEIVEGSTCAPATPSCQGGTCVAVCVPGNYCVGGDLRHQNADCSTELVQTCEFGCSSGACNLAPPVVCGDGFCENPENNDNCAFDCPLTGFECGDGVCDPGENVVTCFNDCFLNPPPPPPEPPIENGDGNGDVDGDGIPGGVTCGNALCDAGEDVPGTVDYCPADCVDITQPVEVSFCQQLSGMFGGLDCTIALSIILGLVVILIIGVVAWRR